MISYLSKKKEKLQLVKFHFYHSAPKNDDLITRYFPFSLRNSPKNRILCLHSGRFPDFPIFIRETILVHKLETFKNCKEVKHIMIMIIAIIYTFLILCDIWSSIESYFQKILRPSQKKSAPPFYSLAPKNSKSTSPPPF